MAYGYYPRRRFRTVAVKSKTGKKPNTPRSKNNYKKSQVSFSKKVNEIISRNVENKMTTSYNETSPVCVQPSTGANSQWYLVKDWNTKIFTLAQGAQEAQRIANQIKLKRWIIKGILHPVVGGPVATTIPNTSQGYVDIYFGRLLNNGEISNTLPGFLDSGNTSSNPTGAMSQIFRTVNKDEYKVYFHKRFKVSPATSQGGQITVINNDFSLVKTFGFDVCKYICKNTTIKYNDTDNDPNNAMIRQLALWATWTPAVGDMGTTVFGGAFNHYYNITIQAYAEYEDA